jgi:hypothetical protein
MDRHFKFVSNLPVEKINNAVMLEAECSKTGGGFCNEMGVKGFPTIVLMFKNKWMKYPGGRTHSDMTEFLGDDSKWIFEDLPGNIANFLPVATADTPTLIQGKISEVVIDSVGDVGEIPVPIAEEDAQDIALPPMEDVLSPDHTEL